MGTGGEHEGCGDEGTKHDAQRGLLSWKQLN